MSFPSITQLAFLTLPLVLPSHPARAQHAAKTAKAGHPQGVLGARVEGFSGRPFGIRVSSRGTVLITQQDANSIAGFTLAKSTARMAPVAVGDDPGDVVLNRAGTIAYVSAYNGGSVHVIDVASGTQIRAIPVSHNAYRLALSGDEKRLFVTSNDGSLYMLQTDGEGPVDVVPLGGTPQGLCLSKAGRAMFATTRDGGIWRIDPSTFSVVTKAHLGGRLQDVAVSLDGRELYVADESGWVDVLDARTLDVLARISLDHFEAFGMALTPDGAQLYVSSPGEGHVLIIDTHTRSLLRKIAVGGTPRRVAFSADGRTAVVANERNWVDVIR